MFLKSLTLRGFKSFADKTVLDFEPGVTVVVGPNGSGKSNLVDAVAWVLGAQGPRTLRGGKMDDVIFAGTPDRPALGRAEVSLTIDNTAHLLPIEFSEVTISRTLFRTSGESEYQLNSVSCRLLDIQELLSDSGIGREQHVIVGQGQLDTILNASPSQRRAIVEEAAGILKYRKRKERAERRLLTTEGNLLRLTDLLREVRRQLAPLQRQAEAAQRHGTVIDELRAIRLHLAGHHIAGLQTRLARLHDEHAELERRESEVRGRLRSLDDAVIDAERSLTVLGADGLADWMVRVEALRERGRGLAALLDEKRRGVERELAAAADEGVVETLVADAVALRNQVTTLDAETDALTLPGTDVLLVVEAAEAALAAAEQRWRSAEGDAARARAHADAVEHQLVTARTDAAAGQLDDVDGVVGPLVDHLEIEPGAEAAVAAALGDAMRAVVVRGDVAARRAVERVRGGDAHALLLVIDADLPAPATHAARPGVRPVVEVVHARAPGLDAVLGHLLAGAMLVHDWRAALDLVLAEPGVVAVTPDGDRLGGVGPWRLGGSAGSAVTQAALDEALDRATTAEVTRAEAERTVESARAALGAARAAEVRRAAAEERRAVLAARLAEVESRLETRDPVAQATAEQHRVQLLERDARYAALARRLADHRHAVDALHDRLRQRRQREAEAARASADQLDVLRTERADLERGLLETREGVSRVEIGDAESRVKLETAIDALRAEFDVEPAAALDAPKPEVPEGTTLAGRARELERDLRLMGPINPLALEEHRALQERAEFLQSQLDDVRDSRRELNRVIKAVDKEIVKVFEQAFTDVADHFVSLFSTLFPGGVGRLSLLDPDDMLETGIEIEARPSGKNVRRLSLLSGGERSLTALAYLFAVFRARPSPFYLLDEVEAALDDVNLHRFLDLVHEFRDEAQLVVVTHQKRTMEAGDILYGVSMPPGGSTRVVSQRAADVTG
ncbi:MAG TPA: AAA family ATPase [Acidimicrobiia bacterium]